MVHLPENKCYHPAIIRGWLETDSSNLFIIPAASQLPQVASGHDCYIAIEAMAQSKWREFSMKDSGFFDSW